MCKHIHNQRQKQRRHQKICLYVPCVSASEISVFSSKRHQISKSVDVRAYVLPTLALKFLAFETIYIDKYVCLSIRFISYFAIPQHRNFIIHKLCERKVKPSKTEGAEQKNYTLLCVCACSI